MHQKAIGRVIALPNMEDFVAHFAKLYGWPVWGLGMDGVEATGSFGSVQQFRRSNQIHINCIGQMFDVAEETHATIGTIRARHKSAVEGDNNGQGEHHALQ